MLFVPLVTSSIYMSPDIKQLLDEVFVISRIIKVEVGVISRIYTLNEKKMEVMFLLLHWRQVTQNAMTLLPVTLSVLNMIVV